MVAFDRIERLEIAVDGFDDAVEARFRARFKKLFADMDQLRERLEALESRVHTDNAELRSSFRPLWALVVILAAIVFFALRV